jgi:hypothetical protein
VFFGQSHSPLAENVLERFEGWLDRRTAHNTAKAIAVERRLNDALVAERNKPPPF